MYENYESDGEDNENLKEKMLNQLGKINELT